MRLGFSCLLLFASAAQAGAPPLAPNEEIIKTKDGCAVVIRKDDRHAKYIREHFSSFTWEGACIDGLMMGEGLVSAGTKIGDNPMEPAGGWFWYGRDFGITVQRWSNGGEKVVFTWDGRRVSYTTLDTSKATWDKDWTLASNVNDGKVMVSAAMNGNDPAVFVFDLETEKSEFFPCPIKGSYENCEAVWAEHAGPVIQRVEAFLTENERKARARQAEIKPLVAKWEAKVGSKEVARRKAAAWENNQASAKASAKKLQDKLDAQQACHAAESAVDKDHYDSRDREHDAIRDDRYGRALRELVAGPCRDQPKLVARMTEKADRLIGEAAPKLVELARVPELMQRADQYFNAGDYEMAQRTYFEIVSIDSRNTRARLGDGIALLRSGNYLGAKWQADMILRYDPNNSAAQDLTRAAEAGERQRDIAYQQQVDARRREDWNLLGNAVNTFVQAKVQATAQEQAEAQARAQAQADAQARAQSQAQQQASARQSQESNSTTSSPSRSPSDTPNPASNMAGCVARGVRTNRDGKVLDMFENRCGQSLSMVWRYAYDGSWDSVHFPAGETYYKEKGSYTDLTLCIGGRAKWPTVMTNAQKASVGNQAWCY